MKDRDSFFVGQTPFGWQKNILPGKRSQRAQLVQRRLLILFFLSILIFVILGLRLFDLQIVQGTSLRTLSDDIRFFVKRIPATRGIFFDRFAIPLVQNKPMYLQVADPERVFSPTTALPTEQALSLLASSPPSVIESFYRLYHSSQAISPVVGYVGSVSEEDLKQGRATSPQQLIGKSGLERKYDTVLRGIDGKETFEIDAQGKMIRSLHRVEPVAGENIFLTLDQELTQFAYQLLGDKKGAIIVGDLKTGQLLALVSRPGFDANTFTLPTYTEDEEKEKRLRINQFFTDPQQLFFNHAVAGAYPPGSIFKIVTALAGLQTEAINEETEVIDQGVLKVNDFEYRNWYYRQYGRTEGAIRLVRAIARSNDIYFYKAAEWIGPDALAQAARLMGFGRTTGIDLSTEATGLVPDPSWKERVIGEKWYLGNTYHYGIGQGDLTVSPVQIFQMLTLFSSSQRLCQPHLKIVTPQCKELSFEPAQLKIVHQGMIEACSDGGTGYPFFPWNREREDKVACKTGTAEYGAANEKGFRNTHGWFVATWKKRSFREQPLIATPSGTLRAIDKYEYPTEIGIVVLVESNEQQPYKEGSRDAAPLALEIIQFLDQKR